MKKITFMYYSMVAAICTGLAAGAWDHLAMKTSFASGFIGGSVGMLLAAAFCYYLFRKDFS